MSDCDKCGAHWMQSCDCVHEVFSQEAGLICSKTIEIQKLQAQLDEANKLILSLETNMLHDLEYKEWLEIKNELDLYLEKYNVTNSTQSE